MQFNGCSFRDREAATEFHEQLRASKASYVERGKFYLSLLDQRLWSSQRAVAAALDVSLPQVSRMISVARLPDAVLSLFANKTLSFRSVDAIQILIRQLGEDEIARRARRVPQGSSVQDIVSTLTTGSLVGRENSVRLQIVPGKKYLRLDVPNFDEIAPQIAKLEAVLNLLLVTDSSKPWMSELPALALKKR
jgi:hypothetical protein